MQNTTHMQKLLCSLNRALHINRLRERYHLGRHPEKMSLWRSCWRTSACPLQHYKVANDLRDLSFTGADALGTPKSILGSHTGRWCPSSWKRLCQDESDVTALSQHPQLLWVNDAPLNANSTSLTNCTAHATGCDRRRCTGNIERCCS